MQGHVPLWEQMTARVELPLAALRVAAVQVAAKGWNGTQVQMSIINLYLRVCQLVSTELNSVLGIQHLRRQLSM